MKVHLESKAENALQNNTMNMANISFERVSQSCLESTQKQIYIHEGLYVLSKPETINVYDQVCFPVNNDKVDLLCWTR
jgi:hypothetical protein